MSEWIKMADQLPPDGKFVIFGFVGGQVTEGSFDSGRGAWIDSDSQIWFDPSNHPTHWMPLPEPPGATT